ncbi:MAG TPA: folylpolyglutamate synthase/dihydrofolate synthase family protein [Verrucomicrobiae bacterium]|nr:folylpolyglutamate synthase/dihydrofolate synthase family protein [Verrucomicrobiae bacterium]
MNYEQSVAFLLSLGKELASPRQASVQKFNLENIRVLAEALGSPHRAIPCAHVGGTNGKGSTAAMLESILRASGLSTGLFTSPHLQRINERIAIDGQAISDEEFAAGFSRVHEKIENLLASGELAAHPTFFECVTAMAFAAFAARRVNFAVYEVGMGGRLDSTNIISPEVAIITQIGLDHEDFLGHSIAQIAAEKAGVIKPGAWVVSAAENPEARDVIARRAEAVGARLVEIDDAWKIERTSARDGCYSVEARESLSGGRWGLEIPLRGRVQIRNALTAATAGILLGQRGFSVSKEAIERGVCETRWPGRLERLAENPAILLDGAHNPAAARELAAFLEEHLAGRRIWLIFGAVRDKSVDEIAGLIFPQVHKAFFTEPQTSRAISAELLAEMTSDLARQYEVIPDPREALARALSAAAPEDVILVAGSLYLVGYLREHYLRAFPSQLSHTQDAKL